MILYIFYLVSNQIGTIINIILLIILIQNYKPADLFIISLVCGCLLINTISSVEYILLLLGLSMSEIYIPILMILQLTSATLRSFREYSSIQGKKLSTRRSISLLFWFSLNEFGLFYEFYPLIFLAFYFVLSVFFYCKIYCISTRLTDPVTLRRIIVRSSLFVVMHLSWIFYVIWGVHVFVFHSLIVPLMYGYFNPRVRLSLFKAGWCLRWINEYEIKIENGRRVVTPRVVPLSIQVEPTGFILTTENNSPN